MTEPPTGTGRMTVQGLLDESLMSGARVVAGTDRLDRELTWVLPLNEVLSQHDPLDAVAVYARPESLVANGAALSALTARGATTLLVDGVIPPDLGRLPTGLVVVELGIPVGFAALNRLLAERALSQEVHVMRYSTHVHASLAGLFHRGAGLQILVREVSNLARNPAVALDARGHVVAHTGLTPETLAPLADSVNDMLAADVPAAERRSDGHDTRIQPITGLHDSTWTCVASAIRLGKSFEGWVVILVPDPHPGSHDLARYSVLTEQATAIIGSEMLRQRSVDEAEERARGDFVQALVHGSFSSEHDMRARAEHHDIELDARFGVFVAPGVLPRRVDNPTASMVRLARYAAGVAPHPAVHAYVTVIGDVLVVVRTLRSQDGPAMRAEMDEYAQAMSLELERRRGLRAPVAYGRPALGASEVRESYREARVALGIARRLHRTGATSYQELRGFTVLAQVAETEQSRQLVRDMLGPLRSGPDLLETLSAYLSEGGNVNATARVLNVHRNTMLAKLDRISRLLGMDIRVPENQFTVWLAIRLDLLDEVHSAIDREASFR
ncbi:helix-turn-helix domain-containing protein [Mycolicibacterium wolinskyi]|uniref:PucR family transcriptional regulator n=1 Tax=Mycolicibacterium wolinskyi TaxID=59750 RepID=A0A1X2EZG0_9MYCO|nr:MULTISPECIES: helix-turn-helix domain-containing protein [Mycolicibacterium]MCV7288346.1 helix-turn-helix domain-containing protein [Mycolicibacterium wolinskyi]MCV7295568.1 helix-turn-helix domain-containing protein [Mycolicibacterium goodii]ORX11601.1 PucR family transcriptional regulator [Mycolicibacterium wolinskyi]